MIKIRKDKHIDSLGDVRIYYRGIQGSSIAISVIGQLQGDTISEFDINNPN